MVLCGMIDGSRTVSSRRGLSGRGIVSIWRVRRRTGVMSLLCAGPELPAGGGGAFPTAGVGMGDQLVHRAVHYSLLIIRAGREGFFGAC